MDLHLIQGKMLSLHQKKDSDTIMPLHYSHKQMVRPRTIRTCYEDFLFIVTPIVGVCNCSMFCCTLLYVHSSIAIILMGKRELIALLNLSSWCLVMVERLFLAVPWGCLQFVIVVFPDHTHLLFFMRKTSCCLFLTMIKLLFLKYSTLPPYIKASRRRDTEQ